MNAQAATQAKPTRKAVKIARSVREQTTDSTLANLESRATPASATAGVSPSLKTGASTNFSGQYLYDRFVNEVSREDIAKMDIVRSMVKNLDSATFKTNVAKMVSIAKVHDEREQSAFSAARLKTAQNHQSVMRNAFGALKFYANEMAAAGVDDKTGYHVINTVAKRILTDKGVKWDGSKLKSADERKADQHTKAAAKALAVAMEQHPKGTNESRADYFQRIDKAVANLLKTQAAEEQEARVAALVAKFKEMAGDDLKVVLAALA